MNQKFRVYKFTAQWAPFYSDHRFAILAPAGASAVLVVESAKLWIAKNYQFFYSQMIDAQVDVFNVSVSDVVDTTFRTGSYDYLLVYRAGSDGPDYQEIDKDLAKIYFEDATTSVPKPNRPIR